jgi:cytosine/adenosine deaminase-related metal-dependent hydrolase
MIVRARYVVPIDRPPIHDGAVRIDGGQIAQVGSRQDVSADTVEDLGDVALLPGLINAHAHLELSAYAGQLKPSSLWTWLGRLMHIRRRADPREERDAATRAAAASLHAGVTCIADISRRGDAWRALKHVPIRKVCFAELLSLAKQPPRTCEELAGVVEAVARDDRLYVGVSPHASYSVVAEQIATAAKWAHQRGLPITTHWAETREECRWLRRGGGMLGALIRGFGGGRSILSPRCEPMVYAEQLGLLSAGALLAHVNYISDEELERLGRSQASVVYCPRSHRFFGHEPHRWRDMLAAGINVCVGTDSAASLPAGARLSVLDELQVLHRQHPDVPGETLVSMVTLRAARALGLDAELGSITPGKQADLVAIPLARQDANNPLGDILAGQQQPNGVWISGRRHVPRPNDDEHHL